jgi:transcriptional regulator with XRE-family HTH domain
MLITIVIRIIKFIFATVDHVADDVASRRFAVKVADLLRAERARKGMSMRRLAQKSGLSQPTISYIERGLRIPSLDTAYRIATALDLDLSVMIKGAETLGAKASRRSRRKSSLL